MVSGSASGSSDPSSSLTRSTIFGSSSVNHETFRDIRRACREGGIGAADGESQTILRYVSCFQSRTFPMYIAFWQLHSHLYLENSRVIWDSVHSVPYYGKPAYFKDSVDPDPFWADRDRIQKKVRRVLG